MRALALLPAALCLAACGRIGYDPADQGDDVVWLPAPCNTAVKLADLGPTMTPAPTDQAVDVASTDLGFVAVWTVGKGEVRGTSVAVGYEELAVKTSDALLGATASSAVSVAAIGDDVLVGYDDGSGIALVPVDAYVSSRGDSRSIAAQRGAGHGFVAADPAHDLFVVLGGTASSVSGLTRDHLGAPLIGPVEALTSGTAGLTATPIAGGYAELSSQPAGSSEHCDLVPVDNALVPSGAVKEITMTCHNSTVVADPTTNHVVAAWNCENDAVWVSTGPADGTLSEPRAVYQGDSTTSGTDPRMARSSSGIWYGYRAAGTHLGRALIDQAGNDILPATEIYTAPTFVAYDLVTHGDEPYFVWLESGTADELWAMRVCPPQS